MPPSLTQPLRIYADFNGLVRGVVRPDRIAVVLDTLGSIRDLSNAGVVLTPGLPVIAADASDEHEDLEGHGTAQYDAKRRWWVVEFDSLGVRHVAAGDRSVCQEFLCVSCREPIDELASLAAFRADAACPRCSTSVLAPIAPPR